LIEEEDIKAATEEAKKKGIFLNNPRLSIDTSLIVNMCMKAANGVHYLHSKNIIHRDIKAANFLVDEHYNVFVIDYGVSRVSPDDPQEKQTVVGTPVWMAPEVFSKQPYSDKADSYSFALVLWGMITGKAPYADISPLSLPLQICVHKYREPIPEDTDPRLRSLITQMWDPDPDKRLGMLELLNILYDMKDEITGHFYCRVQDHVPDCLFYYILQFMDDQISINALCVTSRRFNNLVQKWSDGTLARELETLARKSKTNGKARSDSK